MTRTILKISAFILALGSLVFLTACDNLMDTPKSRKGEGTITFSVAGSKERTVTPTINIAKYQLFGGKTGETEELITEFTGNEVNARLETGEWNFTLKALDALGTIILQDTKAATLTTGGSLRITFNLKPLSDGVGSVSVTVNFPFTRINQVDVSFVGETNTYSNTYSIFGGPFIFNKNDVVPGDHLLTLVFRNGSDQLKTIREIVKVGAGLKSEKVFNFTEADLGNAFFTEVFQNITLYDAIDIINRISNDQSNYLVELTENDISTGYTLRWCITKYDTPKRSHN